MSEPSAITGLPDPHVAIHAVGIPAMPSLNREAVLFEDAGQVLRRLEFLKAQLAEAEDHVDHLLRGLVELLDTGSRLGLQPGDACLSVRSGRLGGAAAAGGDCARTYRSAVTASAIAVSVRGRRPSIRIMLVLLPDRQIYIPLGAADIDQT